MIVEILPATMAHVQELGLHMNVEDREEAEAMGLKAHRALWRSWKSSTLRTAALVDGEVAAIWGVIGSFIGMTGLAWFVTGPKAREVSPLYFAQLYRREVRKMLEIFPRLENRTVDSTYNGAVKMLQIAGFKPGEAYPVGPEGRLYRLFYKEA